MKTDTSSATDLKLVIERTFQAPRQLVWDAWADGEKMGQWSCPTGFVITAGDRRFKTGGKWSVTMKAPSGDEHTAYGEYLEISPIEKLVFTHRWKEDGKDAPITTATILLEERNGGTHMTFIQTGFASVESRDGHREGWGESFDKLAEHIAGEVASRELTISRVFEAPRQLVFDAFTQSEHLGNWWGPRGFQTRVDANDFRVGGRWRFVMVAPDGSEYPAEGTYRKIVAPERFVTSDEFGDDYEGEAITGIVMEASFKELTPTLTQVTLRLTHESVEDLDRHVEMGVIGGWNSALDCLDGMLRPLAPEADPDREIVVRRLFAAPKELVFEAWTDIRHVSNWWGPKGFTTTTHSSDFRPGGIWRFTMHGPDGTDYENKIEFLEVLHPDRITYRHLDDDNTDGVAFAARISFEQTDGGTLLTLRSIFASPEYRNEVAEKYGAIEGARDTLSRLEEHVVQSGKKLFISLPSDREIRMTRLFDAPRDLVYAVFTTPEHIRDWWAFGQYQVLECEIDFREGKKWRISQKDGEGHIHTFKGEYLAIAPGESFSQTFIYDADGMRDHPARDTYDFIACGDRTLLVNTMRHDSKESRDGHVQAGMEDGATLAMEQVEKVLAGLK